MTTPAPSVTPPAPSAAPPGPPPSIVPNRQRLDNRFPVLAFTIRTFGRPLFEVLLATDRTLFDPANAARRTPSNFYAGRQDGGLARATAEDTAFVVPASALRRFADAKPRPGEIYFTVAAYHTAEGPPALAQPASVLATTAPWVLLGRDFAAHTLASVLSVPAHKLAPMTEQAHAQDYAPAMGLELDDDDIPIGEAQSWTSEFAAEDEIEAAAAAWAREPAAMSLDAGDHMPGPIAPPSAAYADEDGYGSAYGEDDLYEEQGASAYAGEDDEETALAYADDDEPEETSHAYAGDDDDEDAFAQSYDDGYREPAQAYASEDEDEDDDEGAALAYDDDDEYAHAEAAEDPYPEDEADAGAQSAYGDAYAAEDYDDGYGSSEAGWAGAASSEPATLSDADEDLLDRELAGAAAYGDAYEESYAAGHEAYGDEEPVHHGNGSGNGASAMAAPPFGTGSGSSRELDIPTQIGIVMKIGRLFEAREGYAGINADTEFSTPNLPQYGRWHVGLTYGIIGFTQDSGLLGRLLALMRHRGPEDFARIFGPDAGELLRVTNMAGPSSREAPGGRGPRVQPVGGADLWTEPWLSRFRRAAEVGTFQGAQRQLAVQMFLYPMLPFAAGFGLDTERSLAMVVDRAIHMGVQGARRWLTSAIGPVRTDAQRQQALSALRIADLRQLQQASGLRVDGTFGPLTQAALVGALRRLGPASPVPIPTREQFLDAIVARADGEQDWWRQRPTTIRTSREFADLPLQWTSGAR